MAEVIQQTRQLVYDAARELLSGTIGRERSFYMKAFSGGSRGHKAAVNPQDAANYLHDQAGALSSRLATTKEIKDAHGLYKQRGGTLPAGQLHLPLHCTSPHFWRMYSTAEAKRRPGNPFAVLASSDASFPGQ